MIKLKIIIKLIIMKLSTFILAFGLVRLFQLTQLALLSQLVQLTQSLNNNKFATNIVHGGYQTDEMTGNFIAPITLSSTFSQISPGIRPGTTDLNSHGSGYFYGRMGNPTRGSLERALALSENANYSAVFSSGMAAISTIIQLLKYGDHVVAMDDLYGGTSNYFTFIAHVTTGINFTFIDMDSLENLENSIKPNTKLIWLESLTNPLLKTADIKAVSKIAKKHNCLLVIDSTFTSPYLFNGLDFGADIVVHSVTKYISGHSDIIMGAIMCNNEQLIKKIRFIQSGIGAIPSPFDCYLVLRGLKTLHLRMEASQKNAIQIANFLESHSSVEKVIYPGLKSYKFNEIVNSQFRGSGAIISFYIRGGLESANKFLSRLKIFKLAVSLGAVESLMCSPALMTHASVPKETRELVGLSDNLIRISVGIEDIEDLINDIRLAFDSII